MKKFLTKQNLMAFGLFLLIAAPLAVFKAHAADDFGVNGLGSVNLGTKDLKDTIAEILNVLLGFLGVIAVVIILLGGFKWMTAGGEEEKVGEAKKLLSAGIIGLVVILSAYAIARFVLTNLDTATRGA